MIVVTQQKKKEKKERRRQSKQWLFFNLLLLLLFFLSDMTSVVDWAFKSQYYLSIHLSASAVCIFFFFSFLFLVYAFLSEKGILSHEKFAPPHSSRWWNFYRSLPGQCVLMLFLENEQFQFWSVSPSTIGSSICVRASQRNLEYTSDFFNQTTSRSFL